MNGYRWTISCFMWSVLTECERSVPVSREGAKDFGATGSWPGRPSERAPSALFLTRAVWGEWDFLGGLTGI